MVWDLKRIGVVLSGGGAKGAYEIGAFKALEEWDLGQYIYSISGCSIGAYNELLYSMLDLNSAREFLYDFPTLIETNLEKERLLSGEDARYSSKGIIDYLLDKLGESQLIVAKPNLYACAYSVCNKQIEYFQLNGLSVREASQICIASGALPDYFAPVIIRGNPYTDGGVVPSQCVGGGNADKIPLYPLLKTELDCIICIFLNEKNYIDHSKITSSCLYYELRPSEPLEEKPHSGTLDFSPYKLEHHEALGYKDMRRMLEGINSREL